MPASSSTAGCKLSAMKYSFLLSGLIIFFLVEKFSISLAQDLAKRRHIDDVDVHFQEYHLEDDFKPSEILGPISDIKTLGPLITTGEVLDWPEPKKPHWLGSGSGKATDPPNLIT